MQESFTSKFKHKIQFMHRRGLKEMYKSDTPTTNHLKNTTHSDKFKSHITPNPSGIGTTSPLKIPKRSQSLYGYDCLDHQMELLDSPKKGKILTMSQLQPVERGTVSMQNSRFAKNERELDSLDRQKILFHSNSYNQYQHIQNKYLSTLPETNSHKYIQRMGENQRVQQIRQHSHYYNVSRNPEIESLVVKLKEKERQKYDKANGLKYIDEMLNKHQELLKYIDAKNMNKGQTKQPEKQSEREGKEEMNKQRQRQNASKIRRSRQKQRLALQKYNQSFESEGTLDYQVENNGHSHIRVKKIEDIIAQTKLNRIKQHEKSKKQEIGHMGNTKGSYFSKASHKYRKINNIEGYDYKHIEKYDKINKEVYQELNGTSTISSNIEKRIESPKKVTNW